MLRKVMDASLSPQGFYDDSDGITDPVDDYAYDDFGNMTADQNKNITEILYNQLNLPTKITFGSLKRKIDYLYTANGKKVRKNLNSRDLMEIGSIDYLDGFQYRDGWLQFFPTSEGYVRATVVNGTTAYSYVYNYTDHLGNIRLSYAQDPASPTELKILEENHYYPYGLKHTNYNSDLLVHREYRGALGIKDPGPIEPLVPVLPYNYKYNGKEFQDEMGMNIYDYGARNYDPAIGRFRNIDRMAERYENLTPYNYTGNNPVYFIDVNGEWIYIHDGDNQYRYENGKTQHQVDGKWADVDGTTQLSDFVVNIVAGLNNLENSGKTGKGLVDYFSGDKNDVNFRYEKGAFKPNGNNIFIDPKASNLNWTQSEQGYVRTESPFFVKVGHEMAHVQDPIKYHNQWYNENVSEGEIRASHIENKIRQESGLPLRTHYGTTFNETTKTYHPNTSSTLIDCKGNSVYYNHSEGRYLYKDSRGKSARNQMGASINDGRRADSGGILQYRYNYNDGQ